MASNSEPIQAQNSQSTLNTMMSSTYALIAAKATSPSGRIGAVYQIVRRLARSSGARRPRGCRDRSAGAYRADASARRARERHGAAGDGRRSRERGGRGTPRRPRRGASGGAGRVDRGTRRRAGRLVHNPRRGEGSARQMSSTGRPWAITYPHCGYPYRTLRVVISARARAGAPTRPRRPGRPTSRRGTPSCRSDRE